MATHQPVKYNKFNLVMNLMLLQKICPDVYTTQFINSHKSYLFCYAGFQYDFMLCCVNIIVIEKWFIVRSPQNERHVEYFLQLVKTPDQTVLILLTVVQILQSVQPAHRLATCAQVLKTITHLQPFILLQSSNTLHTLCYN